MLSGDLLRRLRLSRGLTQKEIAGAIGCSIKWITECENFRQVPSKETYDKWLKAIYNLPDRSGEDRRINTKRKGKNIHEDI